MRSFPGGSGPENRAPSEEIVGRWLKGRDRQSVVVSTSGKVRYLAVSNWSLRHVQQALDLAGRHGREPFVAIQALYNLLDREAEWELLPLAGEQRPSGTWTPR